MDVIQISVLFLLSCFNKIIRADLELFESEHNKCNESSISYNIVFKKGHHAGTFQKEADITDMASCIEKCCQTQDCDVAFMSRDNCYLVDCRSNDSCSTKHLKRPKYETMLSLVSRPRRNQARKAVMGHAQLVSAKSHHGTSRQMDHPLILNATKQNDRMTNFQQKYPDAMSTRRSEIIDIILAIGASIIAVSAAIIGVITVMRRLTDHSERSQYDTIK